VVPAADNLNDRCDTCVRGSAVTLRLDFWVPMNENQSTEFIDCFSKEVAGHPFKRGKGTPGVQRSIVWGGNHGP